VNNPVILPARAAVAAAGRPRRRRLARRDRDNAQVAVAQYCPDWWQRTLGRWSAGPPGPGPGLRRLQVPAPCRSPSWPTSRGGACGIREL